MSIKKIIVCLFMLAGLVRGENSGGYAASFLNWGAGARAIALGQSFSALAADGSAIYWNPAGMAQLSLISVSAMHGVIFEDRALNFFAINFPFQRFTIGAGWLHFGVSDIQERDRTGQLKGTFDNSENLFLGGFGTTLYSGQLWQLRAGFAVRYFYQSLYDYQAKGLGADFGVLFSFKTALLFKKINLALTAQNLGAKLKWNTPSNHEDEVPSAFRLGSMFEMNGLPLKLVTEIGQRQYQDLNFYLGGEYWFKQLALRAGFNKDRLSAGIGLLLRVSQYGFLLDYAFTSDDVSNKMLHFFNVSVFFAR